MTEAEEETASALSLPKLPSAEEQAYGIEKRAQVLLTGGSLIPDGVVDEVLRTGGNQSGSRYRIIYNFMSKQSLEGYTEFIRGEYGTGGKGLEIGGCRYSVWFGKPGMQIALGETVETEKAGLGKQFLSWEEVSGRIHQLLKAGEYAPQKILDGARGNALKEHAEVLLYMWQDMERKTAEDFFSDEEIVPGGFPDRREHLARLLSQPEYVERIVRRLESLSESYREDRDIMRYHIYRPAQVLKRFTKFAEEVSPYHAKDGFTGKELPIFITQDETDAYFCNREPFSNGRLEIYRFYWKNTGNKERADFLKKSYGIGGCSHALSGADDSFADYAGRGIRLTRGDLETPKAEIFLKWTEAAERIGTLIEREQYLQPADFARMELYERGEMANRVMQFYWGMPSQVARPWDGSPNHSSSSWHKDVISLLSQPEKGAKLVKDMGEALAGLPLDFQDYEKRKRILSELRGYVEGTYILFPEPGKVPGEKGSSGKEQNPEKRKSGIETAGIREPREPPANIETKIPHQGDFRNPQTEENRQISLFEFMDNDDRMESPGALAAQEVKADRQGGNGGKTGEETSSEKASTEENLAGSTNKAEPSPEIQERVNFRITDSSLGCDGPKQKFQYNLEAIQLVKTLESENRLATPEEQETLSRFVGWGGLSGVFDERNKNWEKEYLQLKETLTQKEYQEARATTLNAFYTPPTVIRAMYQALGNMGLKSGNILEPSCGIGNFMGLIPEEMEGLNMYGVELDGISGRIARQLYQKNAIAIQGFESADYPDSFFDCVIGNVPFGSYKVSDRRYDRHNFLIHDYFIAKSLDLARPGGVVAVVTSSGTMDKQNSGVRQYLSSRGDLLGAIRLPNNAFLEYAGTKTVADILFFQKRVVLQIKRAFDFQIILAVK